nr:T9SS type A sorting domain-containing protein [Bacteroidota bacterium]
EYGQVLRIWGTEFSLSGQYLYVSTNDTIAMLYQYDLYASNVSASRITIDSFAGFPWPGGMLRLAPDNKIYYSMAWYDGFNNNFPYPDTAYNMYNMNLSVINNPDQPGLACNFTPFSFYLGGKRTYWGLPNNPDYELGPLAGSACDTIVGVIEDKPLLIKELKIYPNPVKDVLYFTIAANEKITEVKIFDAKGKEVLNVATHQQRIDVTNLPPGLYLLKVITNSEVYNAKFVKVNGN